MLKFLEIDSIIVEKDSKTNRAKIKVRSDSSSAQQKHARVIEEYFFSKKPISKKIFSELNLAQCSDFQKAVLKETAQIPWGETRTYKDITESLRKQGIAAAPQAVGQALKRNPYPLLIPCHRVVAQGSLGGYIGKEIDWKQWLLTHEGIEC